MVQPPTQTLEPLGDLEPQILNLVSKEAIEDDVRLIIPFSQFRVGEGEAAPTSATTHTTETESTKPVKVKRDRKAGNGK